MTKGILKYLNLLRNPAPHDLEDTHCDPPCARVINASKVTKTWHFLIFLYMIFTPSDLRFEMVSILDPVRLCIGGVEEREA